MKPSPETKKPRIRWGMIFGSVLLGILFAGPIRRMVDHKVGTSYSTPEAASEDGPKIIQRVTVGSENAADNLKFLSSLAKQQPWLERKRQFKTNLIHKRPAPQEFDPNEPTPSGAKIISYRSGTLDLKGWFLPQAAGPPSPALVFFHGGFALGEGDLDAVRKFHEAGFAVFTPALRGENGNPGNHELWLGEVDDALSALAWVKQQSSVDPQRVVTFGHSAGGVISALLSLYPDSALLTGSSGGLYGMDIFPHLENIPFQKTQQEMALRVLPPHVQEMKLPHLAYVGKQDQLVVSGASVAARTTQPLLKVHYLAGDHFTSFDAALAAFLEAASIAVSKL
jgi:acetyl esterase/lipase